MAIIFGIVFWVIVLIVIFKACEVDPKKDEAREKRFFEEQEEMMQNKIDEAEYFTDRERAEEKLNSREK
jgi:hypothetical protein